MLLRQEDYQIRLENFHGPLDLLFYLIRRAEVDVHDIPIAEITDQYLEVLRQVDEVDVELAGEFLVMAASLIEIKSRTLSPVSRTGDSGDDGGDGSGSSTDPDDPRYELVQQLLAYQRYRIAADELEHRRIEFQHRYPLRPTRRQYQHIDDSQQVQFDLEDVHVLDLAEAYERIAAAIDFDRLGEHHIEFDETPIELHEEDLVDRLEHAEDQRLSLQQVFEGQNPAQRIGLFLAMLELTRLRRITIWQDEVSDEILMELNDDPEISAAANDEPAMQ